MVVIRRVRYHFPPKKVDRWIDELLTAKMYERAYILVPEYVHIWLPLVDKAERGAVDDALQFDALGGDVQERSGSKSFLPFFSFPDVLHFMIQYCHSG